MGHVSIDLWGPFTWTDGKEYHVLSMIDLSTRWAEYKVVTDLSSPALRKVMDQLWCRYGYPDTLVSDNAKSFISDDHMSYFAASGVARVLAPNYHPSANSIIETFHRNLTSEVNRMRRRGTADVDAAISAILCAYRATVHEGLNETPFRLMTGCEFPEANLQNIAARFTH